MDVILVPYIILMSELPNDTSIAISACIQFLVMNSSFCTSTLMCTILSIRFLLFYSISKGKGSQLQKNVRCHCDCMF